MKIKRCRACNEEKSIDEFYLIKSSKDGYMSICKKCSSEKGKTYRKKYKEMPVVVTEKRCTKCKKIKPSNEFGKNAGSKDGLRIYCSECDNERARERRIRHPRSSPYIFDENGVLIKKKCNKCNEFKTINEFNRNKRDKHGLQSTCRKCHNKQNSECHKKRYIPHPIYDERYVWDESKNVTHKVCAKCKEMKESKEFYPDPTKFGGLSTYCKICNSINNIEYYALNRDAQIAYSRKYRADHPEETKAANERWRIGHLVEVATTMLNWQRNNKPKVRSYKRRRRAQKLSVLNTLDDKQWIWLVALCGGKCIVEGCDKPYEHQDHVIPLCPGTHTLDNVQPLCDTHNLKKSRHYIDYRPEWLKRKIRKYMRSIGLTPLTKREWDKLVKDFESNPSLKERLSMSVVQTKLFSFVAGMV